MKNKQAARSLLFTLCLLASLSSAFAQSPLGPPQKSVKSDSLPAFSGFGSWNSIGSVPMVTTPQQTAATQARHDTVRRGEALLKSGNTDGAISAFQQALTMEPHDGLALQRLAEAYTAKGQTDQALAIYRTLLYPVPGQNWGSSNVNDATVLSHFALLLLQKGQQMEALSAYQRAAGLLNHEDGKAHALESDLPDLGDAPDQVPYTPQSLLAMVHLAAGIDAPGYDTAELRQAVALAPNSAAAYFYLGKCLYAKQGMYSQEAKATLQKAVQLGDDRTAKAAQGYLKFLH